MRSQKHNKKTKHHTTIFLLLFLLIIITSISIYLFSSLIKDSRNPHVFSHRGASGEEIEHTLAAYDLAIMYGTKYIEPDVVTSKDNTLFISHDTNAKKLTGKDALYKEMTDSEIKNLRTANGEKILTLDELFLNYKDSINYVIELKENDTQVDLFREIVLKHNLADNIIIQTSTITALEKLNKQLPNMKKLLLIRDKTDLNKNISNPNVDIFSMEKSLMSKEIIETVHSHNKEVNFWTLNSTEEIKKAIELNVDTYFTNFTSKALLLEDKYRPK